jgi:hypothetical protein
MWPETKQDEYRFHTQWSQLIYVFHFHLPTPIRLLVHQKTTVWQMTSVYWCTTERKTAKGYNSEHRTSTRRWHHLAYSQSAPQPSAVQYHGFSPKHAESCSVGIKIQQCYFIILSTSGELGYAAILFGCSKCHGRSITVATRSIVTKREVATQNQWDIIHNLNKYMPIPAAARLLRLRVRMPPDTWVSFCFECCALSGTGLCVGLITRPEESYRVCCVRV